MVNNKSKRFITFIIIVLLFPDVTAESMTLKFVDSPRANGMGSCVSTLVDPQSAYYNPGALGVFFLDNSFGFTMPTGTNWAPNRPGSRPISWVNNSVSEPAPTQTLKSWSVNYGFSKELKIKEIKKSPKIGFGAAYSYMSFNSGVGSSKDKVSAITLSFGVQFYLRAGIGYTKKIVSDNSYYHIYSEGSLGGSPVRSLSVETKTGAHDLGFLLSLPIQSFFENGIIIHQSHRKNWKLNITPSVAYVKAGGNLPNFSRFGMSVETELVIDSLSIASVIISKEKDKASSRREPVTNKWGMEIGALETVFVRFGKIKPDLSTFGFGVHPLKVFELIFRKDILQNVDLSLDFAKWSAPDLIYDKTEFFKATVTF